MIAPTVTSKASRWNSLARPIGNQTRSMLLFSDPASTAAPMVRYAFAALAVAVTTGCGLLVFQFAESRPFPLFLLPILFSGWFFGRRAGFLATGLSATAVQYFFIPPVWSFAIHRPVDWGSQMIFIAEGIIITLFAAAKKRDEEDLERRVGERNVQLKAANQELQQEIAERKLAENALHREYRIVQLIRDVAEAANLATNTDQALQSALGHICNYLDWPLGHAYRLHETKKAELVSTKIWYVKDPPRFQEFQRSTDLLFSHTEEGFLKRAVRIQEAIWVQDVLNDPDFLRSEVAIASGIKTCLVAPVLMGPDVVALLEFFSTETKEPDDHVRETIRQIGIQLGRVFERQDAQKKLREQERLAAIGRTAAVLAHEIGTPLSGMSIAIQILMRKLHNHGDTSGEVGFSLRVLSEETNRLTALLRNFRSLARSRRIELNPTDLSAIIREVLTLEELSRSPSSRGIEMALDCPSELPEILANRDNVKQLLLNLYKNAFEAMPKGGKLTTKTFIAGKKLHLHIIDTGLGIPDGTQIFEPFVTTKSEGTGLGLMIVKQIVSAHRGTISYASEPGKGTTFRLTFPLLESSEKTRDSLGISSRHSPE